MGEAAKRIQRRRSAKSKIADVIDNADNVVVIHYSCESFYERPDGASPRITSIAVRNLGTGQTTSFSIHQMAERDKKLDTAEINQNYNELEKKILLFHRLTSQAAPHKRQEIVERLATTETRFVSRRIEVLQHVLAGCERELFLHFAAVARKCLLMQEKSFEKTGR